MPPYDNQPNPQDPDSPSLPNPVPPHQPVPQPGGPAQPQAYDDSGAPPLRPQEIRHDLPAEPQTPDPNRYDFFMESKPKQANPILAVAKRGNSFMLIAAGAGALVVILIIVAAILSNFSNKSTEDPASLNNIIHEQQEIIRVTGLAADDVQGSSLTNAVVTTKSSVTSSQQQFIAYASSNHIKVNTKDLSTYVANSKTDDELSAAAAASTYDTTFTEVMDGLLSDYQSSLNKLSIQAASNPNEKNLADQSSDGVTLLKKMLTQQ